VKEGLYNNDQAHYHQQMGIQRVHPKCGAIADIKRA
jgi:hypothetical protein